MPIGLFGWLVEAADGGSCIVRLVNSGFGSGGQWDAQCRSGLTCMPRTEHPGRDLPLWQQWLTEPAMS